MLRKTGKKTPKDEFNDVLSQHPDAVAEMIHQFIDRNSIQSDETNNDKCKETATDNITKRLEVLFDKDALQIKPLGGDNNLNLLVTYKDEQFVIQIGTRREAVDHALDLLAPKSSAYLAKVFKTHTIDANTPSISQRNGSTTLGFMTEASSQPEGTLIVMEKVDTSLEQVVKQMMANKTIAFENEEDRYRQKKSADDPGYKFVRATPTQIQFAASIGQQSASILSTMNKKNVVWSDFKPKNILLRNSDGKFKYEFAIADTKAMLYVPELPINNHNNKIALDSILSPASMSAQGDLKITNADKMTNEEFRAAIEKEHSYQIATAMYYAMTGVTILNGSRVNEASLKADESLTFKFGPDHLRSPEAKRLAFVIKRMGDPDPDNRMHYKDGQKLLAVLDDEKKFNAVLKKIKSEKPHLESGKTSDIYMAFLGNKEQAKETLRKQKQLTQSHTFSHAMQTGGSIRRKATRVPSLELSEDLSSNSSAPPSENPSPSSSPHPSPTSSPNPSPPASPNIGSKPAGLGGTANSSNKESENQTPVPTRGLSK